MSYHFSCASAYAMLTRVWFHLTQGTVAQHSLRGPYALGFLAFTIGSAYAKAPFLHERQATSMKHVSKEQGTWHGLRSVQEGLLTPSLRACLRGPYADFCLQSENLGFPGGVSFKHLFHSERAMPFSHHMSQHDMRWANPRDKQIGFFSHLICTPLETKTVWVAAMSSNYKVVPFTYLKWISSHVLCSQNQHFPFNCFHFGFFRGAVFFFSMLHSKKLAHLVVLVYQREPM